MYSNVLCRQIEYPKGTHTRILLSSRKFSSSVRSVIHLSLKKQPENFNPNDPVISKNKRSKTILFAYVKNTLADFS